jgi:hypothetical protein
MTRVLDRIAIDGDVSDVLDDCDQVALGLGRLRRQGRLSWQDWQSSTEHLARIRAEIEVHLTPPCVEPELQGAPIWTEPATGRGPVVEMAGQGGNRSVPWQQTTESQTVTGTATPSSPDQHLPARSVSIRHTRYHSLTRMLTRLLHAWLKGQAEEHEYSSIPRIMWP